MCVTVHQKPEQMWFSSDAELLLTFAQLLLLHLLESDAENDALLTCLLVKNSVRNSESIHKCKNI